MIDANLIVVLLIIHWIGDFTHLSRPWMLKATAFRWPLLPILAHAGVHASMMFVALICFSTLKVALIGFMVQLATHFVIDVTNGWLQARFAMLRDPSTPWFWWLFGYDQLLHGIVIVSMAIIR